MFVRHSTSCKNEKGDNLNVIFPVSTRNITSGMILGRDIILDSGKILFKKGTILNNEHINYLSNVVTQDIYIISGTDKLLPIDEGCQENFCLRQKIIGELLHVFETECAFTQMPVTRIVGINKGNSLLMESIADTAHIINMVKNKYESTYRHCVKVGAIAAIIGSWLGYNNEEVEKLMLTGLLHDIGKAIIPLEILNKPSKLNGEEMGTMRRHSAFSYKYLSEIKSIPNSIKVGVLQHHERLDGSGYPLGLNAEDIHDLSKIIAIADIYDAITSDRVYRPRMAHTVALKIIQAETCEGKLDPWIGRVFLEKATG
jgi:putative nucleotidyltransferase with HDIG domain